MIRWDERNKRWRWEFDRVVDVSGKPTRIRKSRLLARGLSQREAEALGVKMEADLFVKSHFVAQTDEWESYVDGLVADRKSWLYAQVVRTKNRAKVGGLAGNLSARDVEQLMRRSRGRCEVTGLRFQHDRPDGSRAKPLFHSIDRIDCTRGYESWNCRLVCFAVNVAMNNWGEAVFAKLATGFVVNRYCAVGIFAANGMEKSPHSLVREMPFLPSTESA